MSAPYTVHLKQSAEKELEKLPEKVHNKIIDAILLLRESPFPRKVKKIQGREGFRIRIGPYRVLYLVNTNEKKIEIVSVAHRKEVYR